MLATEIDLQAWCGPDSSQLPKPFVRNEWRCATDGKAMVRLPAPGEPDTEELAPRGPPTEPVFAPAEALTFAPWPADWEMWETMEIPGEREECPECHGETAVCPGCDGDGQVECDECGQERDCPKCDGEGHVGAKCPECMNRGTITTPARAFHLATEVWVAERYLRRVVNLPNLRWAARGENKPVFFRFDGGEAVMMPVTPKEV